MVTFADSSNTYVRFDLNDYNTASGLAAAITAVPYQGSYTHTSHGLKVVRESVFTESAGMRPSSYGASRVLVVLTDGTATEGYAPATEAARLRDELDVTIYAIGVGRGANVEELESMASPPIERYLNDD